MKFIFNAILIIWGIVISIILGIVFFALYFFFNLYDLIFKTNYSSGFLPPKGR